MLDPPDVEIARLRASLAEANEALNREVEARTRSEELQRMAYLSAHAAIDSIPGFVGILAPDGDVETVNHQLMEYCGLTLEDLRKWSMVGIVHPDDLPQNLEIFSKAIAAGEPYDHEIRVRRADGVFRWFSNRGVPIKDGAGKVLRWYILLTDINDRKTAEATLKQTETKLRETLVHLTEAQRLSKTGSYTADLQKNEVVFSDELYRIFDLEPDSKITVQTASEFVHPEDVHIYQSAFEKALGGMASDFVFRIVTPKGVVKHLRTLGIIEPKAEGGFQTIGAVQDITASKLAEIALKKNEAELRRVLAQLNEAQRLSKTGSSMSDLASDEHVWSDELYRITGFEPGSKITTERYFELVHPDDRAALNASIQGALSGAIDAADLVIRFVTPSGLKHVRLVASRMTEFGGRPIFVGAVQDVTEGTLAREALAASERTLRQAIDAIPTIVVSNSADGLMEGANQQWLDYTGLSLEQSRGSGFEAAFHPDDLPSLMKVWRRMMRTGVGGELEGRIRRFDGEYRWFSLRTAPFHDESGKVVRWYSTNTDIDDRKKAEQALAASERNLRLTIDTVPAIVFCNIADGKNEFLNRRWHEYTGIATEGALGGGWQNSIHPDDLPRVVAAWQTGLKEGRGNEVEGRMRRADGAYRWFQFRTDALRDETGKIVKWYGTVTDIDDRKQVEDELRRAYNSFADAQRLSHTGSFIIDIVADEYVCSDEAYRIFEYELGSKVTTRRIRDTVHPEDRGRFDAARERGFAGIAGDDFLFRIVTESDAIKYVRTLGHVVEEAAGRPSLVGAVQDVTESKLTEGALRRSEAFLAHGEALSETGSFLWKLDTDEIRWSEQLYRIFEFEPDSLITLERVGSRFHPEDLDLFAEMDRRAHAGLDSEYEHRALMPNGSIKHFHFSGQSVHDADGRLEYMGSVQEITSRKVAEQEHDRVRSELTHAARAMSLGVLTASLAHEVNQPLAGIITNANTCLRMLSADPPNVNGALETARRTIRDGNRASDVVSRLRKLFSKKEFAAETVDLSDATREVLALSAHELQRRHVTVQAEFADDAIEVVGDRVQIQQVILNLLLNACDAVKGIENGARIIHLRTGKDGAGAGQMFVCDNGVGIAPESLTKIFDAFYTTKSDGMGIGLSISRSIIERHRGRLWAEPNDGPGATFAFSIPVKALSV